MRSLPRDCSLFQPKQIISIILKRSFVCMCLPFNRITGYISLFLMWVYWTVEIEQKQIRCQFKIFCSLQSSTDSCSENITLFHCERNLFDKTNYCFIYFFVDLFVNRLENKGINEERIQFWRILWIYSKVSEPFERREPFKKFLLFLWKTIFIARPNVLWRTLFNLSIILIRWDWNIIKP